MNITTRPRQARGLGLEPAGALALAAGALLAALPARAADVRLGNRAGVEVVVAFGDRSRRKEDGSLVRWEEVRRSQQPRRARKDYGYLDNEVKMVDLLSQLLAARSPGGGTHGGDHEREV